MQEIGEAQGMNIHSPSPKYPIQVRLTRYGPNANAFVMLGRVDAALRKMRCSKEEREAFLKEAKSGDYENLIATCERWVYVKWGRL